MPSDDSPMRHDRCSCELDGGKAARIVDKMPDNYVHLGLIAALFPKRDAHLLSPRLPRHRSFVLVDRISKRPLDERHRAHCLALSPARAIDESLAKRAAGRIHQVDYEETVADLEGTARRLVAACGLEWDPACLQFHRTSRPVRTASFAQVRQPVYPSSVGRWKNYQDELADLFAALPQDRPIASLLNSNPFRQHRPSEFGQLRLDTGARVADSRRRITRLTSKSVLRSQCNRVLESSSGILVWHVGVDRRDRMFRGFRVSLGRWG